MSPRSTLQARELAVEGAFVFAPAVYPDERGFFLSPFLKSVFAETVGHALFPVGQISYSVSRRGVVRGVHFTATPPGTAKLVCCPRGRVLDVVVDVRVGSPTFSQWDCVTLDAANRDSLYLPVGVGHLFVALQDDSMMSYTLSQEYVPENELALSPFDPALRLPLPEGIEVILSDRDRAAPSLEQARSLGLLPDYRRCRELTAKFRQEPVSSR
ncbi:dTDP-4-dehydrorhamnose 3,5-epimerase family protein [Streptosporangium sp. NPDC006930]|uniref:dTDP-4-dehydrorhamnose 3,5-epimerase family protein n=1 Tax=unclassified Streptosporangium TaxID=2632669 RepID=UPI00343E126F